MFRLGHVLVFGALLAVAGGASLVSAQENGIDFPMTETPEQQRPPQQPDMPNRTVTAPPEADQVLRSPVLTVDQELLFALSAWGKRTQADLDAEGAKIAADNERLATQLSEEEAQLTEDRATLDPAEFRKRAEAFDTRATRIRRERAEAVQHINAWAEADRAAFFRAALPSMGDLMLERGAAVVLDRRSVFVSVDAIDITQELVKRVDEAVGDGDEIVPYDPDLAVDEKAKVAPAEPASPHPAEPAAPGPTQN